MLAFFNSSDLSGDLFFKRIPVVRLGTTPADCRAYLISSLPWSGSIIAGYPRCWCGELNKKNIQESENWLSFSSPPALSMKLTHITVYKEKKKIAQLILTSRLNYRRAT